MKRVVAVVLVAVLMSALLGVEEGAWAAAGQQTEAAQARRQEIDARLKRIPLNSVVRIQLTDGRRLNAVLQDVGADAITVTVLAEQQAGGKEVILLDDIRRIDQVRGRALRNVLIGVGIGVAVVVGTCALALSTAHGPGARPSDAGTRKP